MISHPQNQNALSPIAKAASAFNPAHMTPNLSKAGRRALGVSQGEAIDGIGIQAYRLKQWEAGRMVLDLQDLRKIAAWYESQGIDLAEVLASSRTIGGQPSEGQRAIRMHLQFSDKLTDEQVDRCMERVEANDDKIGELVKAKLERGIFGGDLTDESERQVQALFGAMAENYLIFRLLQGRNVIEASRPAQEASTIGEFVSQWLKASPVATDFGMAEAPESITE